MDRPYSAVVVAAGGDLTAVVAGIDRRAQKFLRMISLT
jgi:hypothetical protein